TPLTIESIDSAAQSGRPALPWWDIVRFASAALLTAIGILADLPESVAIGLFVIAYVLAGYKIIAKAIRNIAKGKIFDENFLMVVASIGAFAIRDFEEAVTVLIFFGVGELLQDRAIARSKRSIAALMDIRPEQAFLVGDEGTITEIHPDQIPVGSLIQVRPGQQIPLDGVIVEGSTFLDTRALTGESVPRSATVGTEVLSGSVNLESTLLIETTAPFGRSAASRILDLVQNAQNKKAQSEQFITRFARIYTPVVLGIAVLVALIPPLLGMGPWQDWFYNALVFLVISCPCALVISIPLSFFGGIGGASRHGILVKGGNYLEALAQTKVMVLDKTGTLTAGNFVVTSLEPTAGINEVDLLTWAASAEAHSSHPIARSILAYAHQRGLEIDDPRKVSEYAGQGIVATLRDSEIIVGSRDLLVSHGIADVPHLADVSVFVARGGRYVGSIIIEDEIRPHTAQALQEVRGQGVEKLIMLTGDGTKEADLVASRVGIDEVHAELLPEDKITELEKVLSMVTPPARVAVVGDGINDAPMLSRGDIGIAMGGMGSEAAIQAADIVIMNDDVSKLSTAIRIARRTKQIVTQNIVLALGIKLAIMALAILGITSIWFAIFADVGVALIALANALRASRV
ncbi:MAG: cadmium-translocating P-type ATPase, partial [Coriobacteriia bacterium]|nr:cadmium-translocating P-type ATPase [Coriobacteriia bacterium]